jgi:phage tail protein X
MRRLIRPALFTVVSVAAVVGFVAAGRASPDPISWNELGGWLDRADPVDAFAEIARWLGLALAAYVAAVSVAALFAELAGAIRMPRVHRWLRRVVAAVAFPALRHRLLEVTTLATITASTLQAAPVGATPASRPAATMVVDGMSSAELSTLRGEFQGFGSTSPLLPTRASESHYTVREGDTLWDIVEQHYGRVDGAMIDAVAAANPVIQDPDLIRVGWVLDLPDLPSAAPAERPPVAGESTWTVVTVRAGDTLWDIVDTHYGTATAELVWATVEANPELDDPALIYPGQLITLPPPAIGTTPTPLLDEMPPPVAAPPVQQSPPQATVEPAAPEPGEVPSPAPAITNTSTTTQTVPVTTTRSAVPPTTETTDEQRLEPAAGAGGVESEVDPDDEVGPSVAQVIGWTGGAGLAAALLGLATRRRRRLSPRDRHRAPSKRSVDLGVALRETEHLDTAEWAAVALAELASQLRPRPGEPTPVPRLLRLADDHVELVWDVPNPDVIAPWQTSDGGWSWNMGRPDTLKPSEAPSPCPGLVTIGRRDGADVLLNLESCGAIAVDGEPSALAALVHSIALELAGSTFSDSPTVLLVGATTLPGQPDHARVASADEALGWMRDRSDSATALLAHRRLTSLFALRARSRPQDSHEPVIVIVDPLAVGEDQLGQMLDLANGDLGTILLLSGPCPEASWKLECTQDDVTLQPLGLTLTSLSVSAELDCVIEEMIPRAELDADEVEEVGECEPDQVEAVLADHVAIGHQRFPGVAGAIDERQWDVELKVLGQVRCVGAEQTLTPTELHLAIYLAFHPNGESADTIITMLWPNGVAHRTFTNTMASLRRKLGTGSDGEMLFPLGRDSQYLYKLSQRVTTDWHRFLDLVRRAEALPDQQAVELLDEALSLIEGPPFRAAAGYSWAYSDGTASLVTETVALVARRCADLHRGRGERLDAEVALQRMNRLVEAADECRPRDGTVGGLTADL